MHLYRHTADIPAALHQGVVAIGNFDGVHLGHQAIIRHAVQLGQDLDCPVLVLSFEPHPRRFFAPDTPPFRLTPLRAKAHEVERLGVDGMLVLQFDADLAKQSAGEFVQEILLDGLACRHVVTGADFCFGAKRQGTPEFLLSAAKDHAFGLTQLPLAHQENEVISSSRIRDALREGRPEEAQTLLGRPWVVEGRVYHGDARGRSIGFPTANIVIQDYLNPRFGVYTVDVRIEQDGPWHAAVANFGVRPTVDGETPTLEVHLLDFDGDLYHKHLEIAFIDFLRPEQKFDSLDALKDQINKDCQKARKRLQ